MSFSELHAASQLSYEMQAGAGSDSPILSRSRIRPIAHRACSEISGSLSSAALSKAGRSSAAPALPSATHTLRKNPRRLMRLIGEARKSARNAASSKAR